MAVWLRRVASRTGVATFTKRSTFAHGDWRMGGYAVYRQSRHAGESRGNVRHQVARRRIERAPVAHLSAGLRVERRLVEHHFGLYTRRNLVPAPAHGRSSRPRTRDVPSNSV